MKQFIEIDFDAKTETYYSPEIGPVTFTKQLVLKLNGVAIEAELSFTREWEGRRFDHAVPCVKLRLGDETMRTKLLLDGQADDGGTVALLVDQECVLAS